MRRYSMLIAPCECAEVLKKHPALQHAPACKVLPHDDGLTFEIIVPARNRFHAEQRVARYFRTAKFVKGPTCVKQ